MHLCADSSSDDCKKKKLKCIPTADDRNCERCVSGGLSCTFGTTTVQLPKDRSEKYNQSLGSEISQLRQQVSELIVVVHELKQQTQRPQSQNPATVSPHTRDNIAIHSPASARSQVPRQPHFVGPTRSAFGILVGERSLNRIGVPKFDSMPPSGAQSPVGPTSDEPISDLDFWNCCTANDVTRYLVTFQEEVESVYPFIDIGDYIAQSKEILQIIQGASCIIDDERLCSQDITLAKVAIATGLILDEPSKIELTTAIVDSVQLNLSSILSPQVDLKEIQLLAMLVCVTRHLHSFNSSSNSYRVYTTFTQAKNFSLGEPSASPLAKPWKWAFIASGACWTTSKTPTLADWPQESSGVSMFWTEDGVLERVCHLRWLTRILIQSYPSQ